MRDGKIECFLRKRHVCKIRVEIKPDKKENTNRMVKTGTFIQATYIKCSAPIFACCIMWFVWVAATDCLLIHLFCHVFNNTVFSAAYVYRTIMVTGPMS